MNRGFGKWGRVLVTIAIVVGLVIFARTVNWHDTWAQIRKAKAGVLLLATAVNLVSLAAKGVRWWVFLRPIGSPSLWLALRATFAGAGLSNVLVANGGEAARVIFVSRATQIPSEKVLATLALERMFELVGYVVMLVLALSFLDLPPSIVRMRFLAWAAVVVIVVLFVHLIRRPPLADTAAVPAVGWRSRTKQYGQRFLHTLGGISTGPRFGWAMALSVVGWALQVATYHLTAMAAGFDLPLVGTVAALLVVNVGFVVRTTPGNVGIFQMMYAVTAAGFGMDRNQAIAVALLIQALQIIPVTLLGIGMAPEFIFKRK